MDNLSVENVTEAISDNITSTNSCSQLLYSHTKGRGDSCETKQESGDWTSHYCSSSGVSNETSAGNSSVDSLFLKACRCGDEAELRQLIVKGLSATTINEQDCCGRTGLFHICLNGSLGLLRLVAQLPGIDINLADNEGSTPLMIAAQAGHADVLEFLIDSFRDSLIIDQRNMSGMTALMKAALQGRIQCVKLLLDSGANPHLRDPARNQSSLEWAKLCGREACAESIEKFMKKTWKKKLSSLQLKQSSLRRKWPSDPCLLSNVLSVEVDSGNWFRQKLKNPFRYSENRARRNSDFSVFNNITVSAVLCASSAVLQNSESFSRKNKTRRASGKRKMFIPKVEVGQEIGCPPALDFFPTGTAPSFRNTLPPLHVPSSSPNFHKK